jgi:hypothetical protein
VAAAISVGAFQTKSGGLRRRAPNPLLKASVARIALSDLGGAETIKKLGVPVRTLVSFEGH